jgi:hypothetical protein
MLNEIDNLQIELGSDKLTTRSKAFNKLNDILNGRFEELQKVFANNEDLSWESLFTAAHRGVISHSTKLYSSQTELNENDTRITTYSKVMLKICDSPQNGL